MSRVVVNDDGETIDIVRGIGEPCDLLNGSDPLTASPCKHIATREVGAFYPLYICEVHFQQWSSS